MKDWLETLRNMRTSTRWSLGIGLAGLLALTVALSWWSTRPTYGVLYQDLSDQDLGQIAAEMDKWHIPYRLGKQAGSIEVPENSIADARMRLATDGVPSHGTVGLEIFDNADYGMTDFAQKVNYQRAIQGELERTIMAFKEIKFARVHITMKQADLFEKDEESPKASVTIATREGEALSQSQIGGIQNLVAAAVQGLDSKAVIVVDDRGDALSGQGQDQEGTAGLEGRFQQQGRIEQDLKRKITGLLADSLALKDASVSVSVMLNYDHVRQTDQKVLTGPDGTGYVLHRQETNSDPGDASSGTKPGVKKTLTSSVVDYENGRSTQETEYAQGRVQRITVGVVVPTPLPADQQQRLRDVIAAAVGLDASRGDQIQLASLTPTPARAPAQAAMTAPAQPRHIVQATEQQAPQEWVKWVLAMAAVLLGVLTAFGLLRRRRPVTDRGRREAVLSDIQRWLADAGDKA